MRRPILASTNSGETARRECDTTPHVIYPTATAESSEPPVPQPDALVLGHALKSCLGSLLLLVCFLLGAFYKTTFYNNISQICVVSLCGFALTVVLIPNFKAKLLGRGLGGKDLNKAFDRPPVPESLGLVASWIFIILTISCQALFSTDPKRLLHYNSALSSISLMAFLGFVDDVLDLRWRYKMFLPTFASLPLLFSYMGSTNINLPSVLHGYFGHSIELGPLYLLYMSLLSTFCTNAINIYAGINGLEVGQSVIIGAFVLIYNAIELNKDRFLDPIWPADASQNLFSILLTLPFVGVSLGLLAFNWYPSSIFVGDTYTYFAGMTFAVVGILGHFSRTLLLFFMPQIWNFAISAPQLFQIVPCPRHRVPKINHKTGLLHDSGNYTLINMTLKITGPLSEKRLVTILLLMQFMSCLIGLGLRYSRLFGVLFV